MIRHLMKMRVNRMMPIGRTELAKLADTIRFYINEYTVLALKAEPWTALLVHVSDPVV